jgi:hypothetical protein
MYSSPTSHVPYTRPTIRNCNKLLIPRMDINDKRQWLDRCLIKPTKSDQTMGNDISRTDMWIGISKNLSTFLQSNYSNNTPVWIWNVGNQWWNYITSFHHGIARWLTGCYLCPISGDNNNDDWIHPSITETLCIAGLFSMEEYLNRQQIYLEQYSQQLQVLHECQNALQTENPTRCIFWWNQTLTTTRTQIHKMPEWQDECPSHVSLHFFPLPVSFFSVQDILLPYAPTSKRHLDSMLFCYSL